MPTDDDDDTPLGKRNWPDVAYSLIEWVGIILLFAIIAQCTSKGAIW